MTALKEEIVAVWGTFAILRRFWDGFCALTPQLDHPPLQLAQDPSGEILGHQGSMDQK